MWQKNLIPNMGDLIRVCRGLYYHYGIYFENDYVFQFAGEDSDSIANNENVMVRISPLKTFLKDGELEIYEFNEEEKKNTYPVEERITRAKMELGHKGYDLVNNNCEDFANRCVYINPPKDQADKVMSILEQLFSKK